MIKTGILLIFFTSIPLFSQVGPPPPAIPSDSKKVLIDEFLIVSKFEKSIMQFAKTYLYSKSITPEQSNEILNEINIKDYKFTIYNNFSFVEEEVLKKLIEFYKGIEGNLTENNAIFLASESLLSNVILSLDKKVDEILN